MKDLDPESTDPAGAPSPFERQRETESIFETNSFASTSSFTTAFINRAPSK